jgi:hypothetical protein
MGSVREIDSRLTILEVSAEKDFENIKKELRDLKEDTSSIKESLADIHSILNRKEGSKATLKFFAPYILTLVGAIFSLVVLVGYEQRIENERATSKRLNEIEKLILKKGQGNGSN